MKILKADFANSGTARADLGSKLLDMRLESKWVNEYLCASLRNKLARREIMYTRLCMP